MPLIFPLSPNPGDTYAGGVDSCTWVYNGTEWVCYDPYGLTGGGATLIAGPGIAVAGISPVFTIANLFDSGCFGITIDGGGSVPTAGLKGYLFVPYDCNIDCWAVVADVAGDAVIDVWRGSAPFVVPLSAAESIAGTQLPTLFASQLANDLALTTWTIPLVFGDVLAFNLNSANTLSRITLQIKVIKV